MQNLEFHPEISIDIKDSYRWYEEQSEGLGEELLDEIERILINLISLS